jgi:hypothetical protein
MAAPSVTLTIRDGGLGIVLPGAGNIHAKLGPSPLGLINSIIPVTDPTAGQAVARQGRPAHGGVGAGALRRRRGAGPAGRHLLRPGQPLDLRHRERRDPHRARHRHDDRRGQAVRADPGQGRDRRRLATATVVFSIDGGKTYTATPTLTAATVMVPNASFVTLAFVGAGGTSFITGDIWTVATTGTCTLTSGTGVGTVSLSSACPVDAYSVIVTICSAARSGPRPSATRWTAATPSRAPSSRPAAASTSSPTSACR